jgi:hypothetical protein
MKKHSNLFPLLSFVVILATIGAFLFPLGPGLISLNPVYEEYVGYNFVFSNDAQGVTDSYGAFIAVFTLLIIAVVFQLIAFIFSFGKGGRKFSAFMQILAGLCMVAVTVIFFLGQIIVGDFVAGSTTILGWGFIAAGASSAVSALLGCGIGFRVFNEKA